MKPRLDGAVRLERRAAGWFVTARFFRPVRGDHVGLAGLVQSVTKAPPDEETMTAWPAVACGSVQP